MTKLRIPTYFIHWLWENGSKPSQEDLHLALLIQKVYFRIPACDRAVLREFMTILNVFLGHDANSLGSAGAKGPVSVENGKIADIAGENVYKVVTLYWDNLKGSDSANIFVIAHEFAHVVRRHDQMSLVLGLLNKFPGANPYKDKDYKQIYELHEDDADLQTWEWGFDKEFRKFHQEFPEARIPRWFIDFHKEPYNMQQES